jgi:2-polyprenyl-6-methoxyphenol hydroxylase-like FAD-dependent oxidoreductase
LCFWRESPKFTNNPGGAGNSELVSFTLDSEGVTETIQDRATGTSSVIRADYLAACDGA